MTEAAKFKEESWKKDGPSFFESEGELEVS